MARTRYQRCVKVGSTDGGDARIVRGPLNPKCCRCAGRVGYRKRNDRTIIPVVLRGDEIE